MYFPRALSEPFQYQLSIFPGPPLSQSQAKQTPSEKKEKLQSHLRSKGGIPFVVNRMPGRLLDAHPLELFMGKSGGETVYPVVFLTAIMMEAIIRTITITSSAMSLTFFHHICLLRPRLRTLNSRALPPRRSVLSTSKSMRSPLSSKPSMLRVIIPRTSSISRCTLEMASSRPPLVVPNSTIKFLSSALKLPAP